MFVAQEEKEAYEAATAHGVNAQIVPLDVEELDSRVCSHASRAHTHTRTHTHTHTRTHTRVRAHTHTSTRTHMHMHTHTHTHTQTLMYIYVYFCYSTGIPLGPPPRSAGLEAH